MSRELTPTIMLASAVAVSSCSSYQPAPRAFHEATIQPYRVDSGDRLRVTVFDQRIRGALFLRLDG